MSRVISQSLFTTQETEARSWKSYITSGIVHVCLIALLLVVTVPAVREVTKPRENVTLIAPVLPEYKPKVNPPKVVHRLVTPPKEVLAKLLPPRKLIAPPPIKPPEVKEKVQLAKAPDLKMNHMPDSKIPEAKIEAPAPPKPEIKTGVFGTQELAKGEQKTHDLKVGGFGDPKGAPPANTQQARLELPKTGAFDMPDGSTANGGGGKGHTGVVRTAGFGDGTSNSPSGTGSHGTVHTGGFGSGDPNGIPGGTGTHGGTVKTGGFGESAAAAPTQTAQNRPATPTTTPVEILYKPKPAYTPEARDMRLEGQVSLEVVFQAGGGIKVVRVVHGLGHGLDEAAEQAATQVRFRPATRGGVPIDTNATIYITFQLS